MSTAEQQQIKGCAEFARVRALGLHGFGQGRTSRVAHSVLVDRRGSYPAKPFKGIAILAWTRFFEQIDDDCDLAYWVIEADSGTVKVSPRSSLANENSPDRDSPNSIVVLVDGIVEAFGKHDKVAYANLRASFQCWVMAGVLESFNS